MEEEEKDVRNGLKLMYRTMERESVCVCMRNEESKGRFKQALSAILVDGSHLLSACVQCMHAEEGLSHGEYEQSNPVQREHGR